MKNYKYKEYLINVIPCIGYGILCGALTGAFVFLFKFLSSKAEQLSRYIYTIASTNVLFIMLVFVALIGFAILMQFLHKKAPEVKGGGIPRSEGVLRGMLSFRWLRTLIGTFVGSMIGFLCGLPLGCEGPAVLMGTAIGSACVKFSKKQLAWGRYIMSGGAGAGFAVATGAPLSGILFTLEEVHKRFTPMLTIAVSVSVVSATFISRLLCTSFNIDYAFINLSMLAEFELSQVGYLLLLGVLLALAVGAFDWAISLIGKFTKRYKRILTPLVKLITVFVITGILGFTLSGALYSGHHEIIETVKGNKILATVVVLFVVRFIMMMFVADSGVTGGIFVPTLAIGALIGAIFAELLILMGMPRQLYSTVVMLSMCAFIGGTLRAPLTATVLFIELSGKFTNLFYVALVVFTVTIITEILNRTPFYDRVLKNMEEHEHQGNVYSTSCFKLTVSHGAFAIGKAVRDIMWPQSTVVLNVKHANDRIQEVENEGEKKLYAEDMVIVRAKYADKERLKTLLYDIVGNDFEITDYTL